MRMPDPVYDLGFKFNFGADDDSMETLHWSESESAHDTEIEISPPGQQVKATNAGWKQMGKEAGEGEMEGGSYKREKWRQNMTFGRRLNNQT